MNSITWKRNEFGAVSSEDYRFAIGHAPINPKIWTVYDRLLHTVDACSSLKNAKAFAEAKPAKKVVASYSRSGRLLIKEVAA